ncbi:hypothetical protein LWI29_012425 [Acer saccharum]|uniref:Uncharacterized protein n=1 Tax=Acer saccharum TaxID=4024 RepID=A0AA39W8E7_ACESA|nr:hypothetical protein LWI29_012425 [Acer saccharum]
MTTVENHGRRRTFVEALAGDQGKRIDQVESYHKEALSMSWDVSSGDTEWISVKVGNSSVQIAIKEEDHPADIMWVESWLGLSKSFGSGDTNFSVEKTDSQEEVGDHTSPAGMYGKEERQDLRHTFQNKKEDRRCKGRTAKPDKKEHFWINPVKTPCKGFKKAMTIKGKEMWVRKPKRKLGQVLNGNLIIGKKQGQRLETFSSSDSSSERGTPLNFNVQKGECSLRRLSGKITGGVVPIGPVNANPPGSGSIESPIADLLIDFEQTFVADSIETDNVGGNSIGPELVNLSLCTSIDSPLQAHLEDVEQAFVKPNNTIDPGNKNEVVVSSTPKSLKPTVCTSLESPILAHLNELELAFVKANADFHQESAEGAACNSEDAIEKTRTSPTEENRGIESGEMEMEAQS